MEDYHGRERTRILIFLRSFPTSTSPRRTKNTMILPRQSDVFFEGDGTRRVLICDKVSPPPSILTPFSHQQNLHDLTRAYSRFSTTDMRNNLHNQMGHPPRPLRSLLHLVIGWILACSSESEEGVAAFGLSSGISVHPPPSNSLHNG